MLERAFEKRSSVYFQLITFLTEAWYTASIDPLVDSDEEIQDENTRIDYGKSLYLAYIIRNRC
jgi:hypothetical protein